MFCRETEQDWDTELADDVKGECSEKYGPVTAIKVIKESQVRIPRATPSTFVLITLLSD